MRWLVVADALVIAAIVASVVDCGAPAQTAPLNPMTCMVLVTPPSSLPFLWTCTSGKATNPPQEPCVVGDGGDGEYGVSDCAICTPAELLKLNPSARCTVGGAEPGWKYAPKDMTGPITAERGP